MTRVLLISANRMVHPYVFPLGLGYVHAGLKKYGFHAGVLDLAQILFRKQTVLKYMNRFHPDYIGISIRNLDNCCYSSPKSTVWEVKQLVGWIYEWQKNAVVIIGGSAFSLLPEEWMDELKVSYGLMGDGTDTFAQLIMQLEEGCKNPNVPGLIFWDRDRWVKYPAMKQNAVLKILPSRDIYIHRLQPQLSPAYNILTKTGCTHQCLFCAYPCLEGHRVTKREPWHVAEEIRMMKEQYQISAFDFVDSVFNAPSEHAQEICREIIAKRLNIRFTCFLNPDGCSKQLAVLLKQAGCVHAELGIDTASVRMLKTLRKGFTKEQIFQCIQVCREAGLSYNVCLLFGGPGETMETVDETLAFLDEAGVEELFGLTGIRILPGTGMYEWYVRENGPVKLLLPQFYCSKQISPQQVKKLVDSKYKKHGEWMLI